MPFGNFIRIDTGKREQALETKPAFYRCLKWGKDIEENNKTNKKASMKKVKHFRKKDGILYVEVATKMSEVCDGSDDQEEKPYGTIKLI